MKILSLLFAVVIWANSYSQSIKNTEWQTYSTLFADTLDLAFGTDTMHLNGKTLGFIVSSLYTQGNGDTISFTDIGGNSNFGCTATDLGVYRAPDYTTDTIVLTLISDECANRGTSYNGVIFWNTFKPSPPTGIPTSNEGDETISLYPNPSNGQFTFSSDEEGWVSVYSLTGNKVLAEQYFKIGKNEINLPENTSNGMYIVKFSSAQRIWTSRLTVEK